MSIIDKGSIKDNVRPIYFELQGYLSQAPKREGFIREIQVWEQYNKSIDELEKVSSIDYGRYKIIPEGNSDDRYISVQSYRTLLGGLIHRIYGQYFPEEAAPKIP